ncbi:hypothetical protein [Enterococcus pallens]|uniref:Uncharacterized protein n=1 Tax=Enterococcus pallens ATCC BAA-351 TaxID=1158607 RepID=R2SHQ4_9ENTE|nr:hypothetical protein [Enterococcus pallens]EOH94810.1 hypothetical protein UAU_01732 [Enterococcus pallens ATCC BAA-351]EOU14871.1 hypothetical protein I588_04521 [Enterococcus pallens ATCC BAA-351]
MDVATLKDFILKTMEKLETNKLNSVSAPEFFSNFTDDDYDLFISLKGQWSKELRIITKPGCRTLNKIAIKKRV